MLFCRRINLSISLYVTGRVPLTLFLSLTLHSEMTTPGDTGLVSRLADLRDSATSLIDSLSTTAGDRPIVSDDAFEAEYLLDGLTKNIKKLRRLVDRSVDVRRAVVRNGGQSGVTSRQPNPDPTEDDEMLVDEEEWESTAPRGFTGGKGGAGEGDGRQGQTSVMTSRSANDGAEDAFEDSDDLFDDDMMQVDIYVVNYDIDWVIVSKYRLTTGRFIFNVKLLDTGCNSSIEFSIHVVTFFNYYFLINYNS